MRIPLIILYSIIGVITAFSLWTNITRSESKTQRIERLLETYQKTKGNVPPATDRDFWDKQEIKPPHIKFNKTKKYGIMEKIRIGTLQVCYYNDMEWAKEVDKTLVRAMKKRWIGKSGDKKIEVLDLTSTRRAAIFAHTIALLEGKINDSTIDLVKKNLKKKILTRYKSDYEKSQTQDLKWGDDYAPWIGSETNWSAVCTANILYCALVVLDNTKEKAQYVNYALESLDDYLKSFENDGYLPAGMRYWTYGFKHYVIIAERLLQATGGHIDLYKNPKVSKIAGYPLAWALGKYNPKNKRSSYPVFSDNFHSVDKVPNIWDILALRFETPWEERKIVSWKELSTKDSLLDNARIASNSIKYKKNPFKEQENKGLISEPSQVVKLYSNDGKICLVAKGGSNSEEHNHNDLGSYIIYRLNNNKWVWVTGDTGVTFYTKHHFKMNRYGIDNISSYGHPVPTVNNTLQSYGNERVAKLKSFVDTNKTSTIVYDLSNGYVNSATEIITRTISFDKTTGAVSITDTLQAKFPSTLQTSLILASPLEGQSKLPITINKAGTKWAIQPSTQYPLKVTQAKTDGKNKQIAYRLAFTRTSPSKISEITYKIVPNYLENNKIPLKSLKTKKSAKNKLKAINKVLRTNSLQPSTSTAPTVTP